MPSAQVIASVLPFLAVVLSPAAAQDRPQAIIRASCVQEPYPPNEGNCPTAFERQCLEIYECGPRPQHQGSNPEGNTEACNAIRNWRRSAASGKGGRFEQLAAVTREALARYGFPAVPFREQQGLFKESLSPARYDPDENAIYFDPEYFAQEGLDPDQAINLVIHEAVHVMDYWVDGKLDVGELQVMAAANKLAKDATSKCRS